MFSDNKKNFIGYVNQLFTIYERQLSPIFLPRLQSLAISFWGIFELIIKVSGDHSPLALYARSHQPSPRASRLSPALAYCFSLLPTEPWQSLWRRQPTFYIVLICLCEFVVWWKFLEKLYSKIENSRRKITPEKLLLNSTANRFVGILSRKPSNNGSAEQGSQN